jgi:hypothetical protein
MNPTTRRPVWACPDWGPEHNWHECPDCMEEFELMIEKAQEWEEETIEQKVGAPSQVASLRAASSDFQV